MCAITFNSNLGEAVGINDADAVRMYQADIGNDRAGDFAYRDSGIILWLLVTELLSRSGRKLSQLVGDRIRTFPCSGEINYCVNNVSQTIDRVLQYCTKDAVRLDGATSHSTRLPDNVSQVDGYEPFEVRMTDIVLAIGRTDGVSVEFLNWRFNLRGSNTEPLLRLNVETSGNSRALVAHVHQPANLIGSVQ